MHYHLVPPHCVYTCTHATGSAAVWGGGEGRGGEGRGGEGGCVHTLWYSWCVCDPQVVQWTQQTTTVGVLCSCCPTPLTVRGQGEQGEGDGGRRGRRMVNGYLLYITM